MIELAESIPAPPIVKKTAKGDVKVGEENLSTLDVRASKRYDISRLDVWFHGFINRFFATDEMLKLFYFIWYIQYAMILSLYP